MSELIADLPYRVVDSRGGEYYVSVAGEPRADGSWEGWLEYVPIDDSEPLLTPTETTQAGRAALLHWADTLSDTYVEGAFTRAVSATTDALLNRVTAREAVLDAAAGLVAADLPDPFRLFDSGTPAMRATLSALSRPALLEIISTSGLNPAGKSLAWLRHHQLVTFIVTAVEAQIASGRRF